MKKLLLLLVLSCHPTVKPSPIPGTQIDCSAESVRNDAINLIPTVTTALVTGQWEAVLLDLVVRWGDKAVNCAVYNVTASSLDAASGAPNDELAKTRVKHGKEWLHSRGIAW